MKKALTLTFIVCIAFIACKEAKKEETKQVTTDSISLPYSVLYSSDFEIGDKKFVQSVLEAWKDYDNNTLQNSASKFADTVQFYGADGMVVKGKDSLMANVSKFRSMFASAVDEVSTVVALKPKGKDETWVCVWGKETDVMKNGKKDSTYLNENWMFNKDGKVAIIYQLAAKPEKGGK